MKMKLNYKILIASVLLFQVFIFSFYLIKPAYIKRNAIKNNRIYTFECEPVDPYNFMKGRYLALSIVQSRVKYSELGDEIIPNNTPLYLVLTKSPDGVSKVTGISLKKPENGDYIKTKLKYKLNFNYLSGDDFIVFDFPFDEYYMQENYAKYVDSLPDFFDRSPRLEIYSSLSGAVIQKGLYVLNDFNQYIPIEDFVKERY